MVDVVDSAEVITVQTEKNCNEWLIQWVSLLSRCQKI